MFDLPGLVRLINLHPGPHKQHIYEHSLLVHIFEHSRNFKKKLHPIFLDAPVEDEPRENTVDDSDYLVATGSRDKTIRVWSMNRGKPIHFFKLPPPSGQRRGWDDSRQRVWLTLYWPKQRPGEIISSSFK